MVSQHFSTTHLSLGHKLLLSGRGSLDEDASSVGDRFGGLEDLFVKVEIFVDCLKRVKEKAVK